jgi:ribonuclease BN (tRNA processing enzyme)
MIKEIETLGTAGAFDFDKVSSSFLIRKENDSLALIDCGHGVNNVLKQRGLIGQIEEVYITHTHFDHIADLEGLIYCRYFIYNQKTTIRSSVKILEELKNIFGKRFDTEYFNGEHIPAHMVEYKDVGKCCNCRPTEYPEECCFDVNHGTMNAVGFKFISYKHKDGYKNMDNVVIVSGDTKACKSILDEIERATWADGKVIIFHDFSMFNNPAKNIHMCEIDYNLLYKDAIDEVKGKCKEFQFLLYHDNSKLHKVKI